MPLEIKFLHNSSSFIPDNIFSSYLFYLLLNCLTLWIRQFRSDFYILIKKRQSVTNFCSQYRMVTIHKDLYNKIIKKNKKCMLDVIINCKHDVSDRMKLS